MKYSKLQITYHWLSFALILVMAGTGLAYSYDLADAGAMQLHQIAGQLLIAVLVARVASRLIRRAPHQNTDHAIWERWLASLVHVGLYICLIAFVITGYVSASGLNTPALFAPISKTFARSDAGELFLEVHYLLKWVLLALVSLHIVGALKHLIWDKDSTFSNITFSSIKE